MADHTSQEDLDESAFHRLADAVADLVFCLRDDGAWVFVNAQWQHTTGQSADDACGLGWRPFIHPEDQPPLLQPANRPGAPLTFRLKEKNGSWRRYVYVLHPHSSNAGATWFAVAHPAPPAPSPSATHATRENRRALLDTLTEQLPIGCGLAELGGGLLMMNPAGLAMHGFSSLDEMLVTREEYEANFVLEDAAGLPLAPENWPLSRAMRGEKIHAEVVRLVPKGGEPERYLSFSVAAFWESAEERELLFFVVLDVTAQKLAAERLLQSEARYRMLFSTIDDGYCLIEVLFDAEGTPTDFRFIEANEAFTRHSGLSDVVHKTAREVSLGMDDSWAARFGDVVKTGVATRFEKQAPVLHRWFNVSANRFGGPGSRLVAVLFKDITQRKASEVALVQSEARAQEAAKVAETERSLIDAVLEASPAGIIVAQANGALVRMNAANQRLWGIAPYSQSVEEHAAWKGYWADRGPRHGQRVAAEDWAMARALRGEFVPGDVVEIEPFDAPGTRRTMINSGAPVVDESGTIVGAIIVQMDITDRVRAEEKLREASELYRLIGRATNDVIWDWNLLTQEIKWNEAVVVHFGCTPAEIRTLPQWEQRIHPEDREAVSQSLQAALDTGLEGWSAEYRFLRNDGTYATFLDRGYIARDVTGQPVRMIGSMLDVTDRRAAEAALLESERRFRTLADNMSQLAWMTDETGYISWYNKRWFDYTGSTLEEMKLHGWASVCHPAHVKRAVQTFQASLSSGQPWEDTFPLRAKDGSYRWFLSRALPILDENGRVTRWFGTNTDITARREAEEALREADRRKDEFIAMLAHELRNPLAPVKNAVFLMKKVGLSDPKLEKARAVIDRQVTHMARLIDDLLDVSRIARGRVELRKRRQDLAQIAAQTAEDYRAEMESAGIRLAVQVPDTPLWVNGDGTRLAQSIGNVLHNARKFTGAPGEVEVRAGADEQGFAVVSVRDTGIGMEPELISRLFTPFVQAHQGLSRSEGGLGLGLALVKQLIELHGGSLEVSSAGLGQGSCFTLRVPLAEPGHLGLVPPAAIDDDGKLNILIIEDNPDTAESLAELLSLDGHHVSVAFDGRGGVELAQRERPDVVISDIGLPGELDGFGVARVLREDPATSAAYLIALSGYSQAEDRRRSAEAGFDSHLTKPPDLDVLEAMLEQVPHR